MSTKIVIQPESRFGRLIVLGEAEPYLKPGNGQREARSFCRCECGVTLAVLNYCLRSGHTQSCGCLASEATGNRRRKHGKCRSTEYVIWIGMRDRCFNPNNKRWADYGGRGIAVCQRWAQSFQAFLADMGPRPINCTIERKNNNGNYEPGNCIWATKTAQARNKRNSRQLTINGRTMALAAWCDEYRINYYVAYSRIKIGWDPIRALTTPLRIAV